MEHSSGPGTLCRAGKVEHRPLALDCGCRGGGPFSTKSSLDEGAAGCGNSGVADGECVGCEGAADTGVCGENGLDEVDNDEHRGTRGVDEVICWSFVRLVEWLGRGRLKQASVPRWWGGRVELRALVLEPGSLGGGGAMSEKSLVSAVDSASEVLRLWDELLLDGRSGFAGRSWSFWRSCLELGWVSSVSVMEVDVGPSST